MNIHRGICLILPFYLAALLSNAQSTIDDQIDSLIAKHAHFEDRSFENFSIKSYKATRLRTKDRCQLKLSVHKVAQYGREDEAQVDYEALTRFSYIADMEVSWVYGGSGITMRSHKLIWEIYQNGSHQRFDNWTLILNDLEKAKQLQSLIQIKIENCKTLN